MVKKRARKQANLQTERLLVLLDQVLQGLQMLHEGRLAQVGCRILRIGLPPDEGLGYADIGFLFQSFKVRGQITVGYLQELFEGVEVVTIIHSKHTHDLEADPVLKSLIKFI